MLRTFMLPGLALLFFLTVTLISLLVGEPNSSSTPAPDRALAAAPADHGSCSNFNTGTSTRNDLSPALALIATPTPPIGGVARANRAKLAHLGAKVRVKDGALLQPLDPSPMPTPILNLGGISNSANPTRLPIAYAPDPNGAIGNYQFTQSVNEALEIWGKNGDNPYGPIPDGTLWEGFGGPCDSWNHADPIVLYDALADRWLISYASLDNTDECVAVSTSSEALGTYNRYDFHLNLGFGETIDQPKLAVWPDAYYLSFRSPVSIDQSNPSAVALNRTQMLAGQGASFQQCSVANANKFALLPADVEGSVLPPVGKSEIFASIGDVTNNHNTFYLWQFHVDWKTPANSNFAGPTLLPVANFNMAGGIPQPASRDLDSLSDQLMYRLVYRNFGDHEALLANHTVDTGFDPTPTDGDVGIRLYEIHQPFATPTVFEQTTYAGGVDRWTASMAMDRSGDLAFGYSESSSQVYPSISYAGRAAGDPAHTLRPEQNLISGGGSQTGNGRWGGLQSHGTGPGE